VFPRDLSERHSRAPISHNLLSVDTKRNTTDVPALQSGSSHSSPNPFHDQIFLKLRNRTYDYNHRAAQWASGVNLFAKADEFDIEVIQFVENFEKMPDRTGHPIKSPDKHNIETVSPSIGHQFIKPRPFRFRTGNLIAVFGEYLVSPQPGHLAQVIQLGFSVLIRRRYTGVNSGSFGFSSCGKYLR